MNMTDELATWISNSDVAVFFTDLDSRGLIRGDPKFGQGLGYVAALQMKCLRVCDFHVNWLHVSRIRPTHWRLNDDFDINRRRRRFVAV